MRTLQFFNFNVTQSLAKICASVGRFCLNFMENLGSIIIFLFNSLLNGVRGPIYWRQIFKQLLQIGFYSLPVVGLTAIFTGMVLALQSHTGFSRFSAAGALPTIVVLSITRELGPVLAGLMVAGRVGAAMAAELGTMRVTEQIDALFTLGVNPYRYLVFPRLIAGFLMLPCLVLVADIIGVMGGYLIGTLELDLNAGSYMQQTLNNLELDDVYSGLFKAAVFGLIISLMGCYHGYHSARGAEGVGRATTNAVVSASILILFMNYILTTLLFQK